MDELYFLDWLISRLIYKHHYHYNDSIISNLNYLKKRLEKPTTNQIDITDEEFDLILAKYYPDFNLEHCDEINIGYSDNERIKIREITKLIINDVINKVIPTKDLLIK